MIFYIDARGRNFVKKFIESLPQRTNRKIARAIQPLSEFGIGTHIKDFKKIRDTPLWEIRILGKDSIRIFYTAVFGDNVLLLHGFVKKTRKTPVKEISKALKRLADWNNRHEL